MDNNFKAGDQLYVNNKWYFDVKSVDDTNIKVRINYTEGPKKLAFYKVITLPVKLFNDVAKDSFITTCTVVDKELKQQIGGLIDRLVKEPNIINIIKTNEDMGAVSSPGMSGTPGVPGSAGSGDVSTVLPAGSFGLEIVPKNNKKQMRKLLKRGKNDKYGIKTPLINLFKENVVANQEETDSLISDNDYKLNVYQFLDYPTDNDWDMKFIGVINEWRPTFIETSMERLQQYFKDLYTTNATLIKKNCSEWFQNNIIILGNIDANADIISAPIDIE